MPADAAWPQPRRRCGRGLPAIQVSPNQGKLLYLLVEICGAGACWNRHARRLQYDVAGARAAGRRPPRDAGTRRGTPRWRANPRRRRASRWTCAWARPRTCCGRDRGGRAGLRFRVHRRRQARLRGVSVAGAGAVPARHGDPRRQRHPRRHGDRRPPRDANAPAPGPSTPPWPPTPARSAHRADRAPLRRRHLHLDPEVSGLSWFGLRKTLTTKHTRTRESKDFFVAFVTFVVKRLRLPFVIQRPTRLRRWREGGRRPLPPLHQQEVRNRQQRERGGHANAPESIALAHPADGNRARADAGVNAPINAPNVAPRRCRATWCMR